jgi:predicted secreted Zn-dependent protease
MTTARTLTIASLAALLIVAEPLGAAAETVFNKSVTYFAVGGRTAAELDAALSSQGPQMRDTGTRHPGATRIRFGGTISYVRRGTVCAVGSARVTLNTKLILPRWKNRNSASRDLGLVWDTLSSDIRRHEERHAEIARYHARDMEKTFLALAPEADCERMQARVARASQDAITAHDKDQADFDRREARNFDQRMVRLLQYRLQRMTKPSSTPDAQ